MQLLKDAVTSEGQRVRLDVRIVGHPPCQIMWFKDGVEVTANPDFHVLQEGELQSLIIPEVFAEDAGNYMVKAVNAAGEAKCYATLSVRPSVQETIKTVQEQFEQQVPQQQQQVTMVQKQMTTVQQQIQMQQQQIQMQQVPAAGHTPPEFQQLFQDKRCQSGEQIRFECVITGTPKPKVRNSFRKSREKT